MESYDSLSAADTVTVAEIKQERKTNGKLLSKSSIKKENSVSAYTKAGTGTTSHKIEKASKKLKRAKHVNVKALMNSSLEYDVYNSSSQYNESGFGGTDRGNMNSSSDGDDSGKHDMSMNSSTYSSLFICRNFIVFY